jgi:LuxR family maltose regulon positive regulatory protein
MGTEVVETRRRIIRRPRLTKLLDESPARIKLLIAPAGYGKTTLAQEWLSEPERKDVWYRGGPAAADVAALAAGLAIAASEVVPDAGRRMRGRLRATGHPEEDVEILAELFAEDLQPWPDNAWLAIDDYHFAMESTASERFIDLLTARTPLRLLITSRRRPSWATARRILYGEILEVDRRALSMKKSEARNVLGTSDPSTQGLIESARGWPAVLGIAALLRRYPVRSDDLPDELYEYFAEELYRGTNASLRDALHRVALVPSVSPHLLHELFGRDANQILEDFARIGAIASSKKELSLHPLLRTFLNKKQAQENPEELRAIAKEMTEFLILQSEWDVAFQIISTHAPPDLVMPLIEAAQSELLAEGRVHTLQNWIDFARSRRSGAVILDLAEAEVAFRQGHFARAEALASQAAMGSEGPSKARALIRAGQAAIMGSRDRDGLQHFRSARGSAIDDLDKLEAGVGICFAALELGLEEEARQTFEELSAINHGGIDIATRKAIVALVYSARVGGVNRALGIGAGILPLLGDAKDPLVVTSFLNCYAHVLNQGAHYSDSLRIAELGASEAEKYRLSFALPHACLNRAISYCGLRDFAKAAIEISNAEECAATGDIHVAVYAAALRCRVALSRRKFREASEHVTRTWEQSASAPMMAEYAGYQALSHACLGEAASARELAANARAIHATSVESVTLAACADAVSWLTSGERNAADAVRDAYDLIVSTGGVDTLVTAFRAAPQFLAVLLDEANAEVVTRVSEVLARSNDFRLARTYGLDVKDSPLGPRSRLTGREAEVANLVAQGHTNQEIAERLFISVSTVKVHMRHIFEKLNARTRAEIAGRMMAD